VVSLFTGDFEEFVEVGSEGLEFVFFTSFGPGGLGEGRMFRSRALRVLWQLGGALVAVGEFALVGRGRGRRDHHRIRLRFEVCGFFLGGKRVVWLDVQLIVRANRFLGPNLGWRRFDERREISGEYLGCEP
jgi:hypothetical protein